MKFRMWFLQENATINFKNEEILCLIIQLTFSMQLLDTTERRLCKNIRKVNLNQ